MADWSDIVIDLSHWQAPVDFAAIKGAGIAGVILKATQGTSWVDATFAARVAAAASAGLLVGGYHFCDASPPAAQACHFHAVAGGLPVLAIDVEPNGMGDTVTVPQAAEIAARIAMHTGRAPLVYMGRWGPDGRASGLPNSVLSNCELWLPAYGREPITPAGWDTPLFWQYTDTGSVAGIGSPCDRNRFAGTPDDLAKWWGGG